MENNEIEAKTEIKKRRVKKIPETLSEAEKLYKSKYLLNVEQVVNNSNDVIIQLVYALTREILKVSIKHDFYKVFENSHLRTHYENLGTSLTNNFAYVSTLLKEMGLDFNDDDLKVYYNIISATCELININILNYSIYIDSSKFGKQRIFNIVENTIFTQIMPTEITDKERTFKQTMKKTINDIKSTQKVLSAKSANDCAASV